MPETIPVVIPPRAVATLHERVDALARATNQQDALNALAELQWSAGLCLEYIATPKPTKPTQPTPA